MTDNAVDNDQIRVYVRANLSKIALDKITSQYDCHIHPNASLDEMCEVIGQFDAMISHGPEKLYSDKFFEAASKLQVFSRVSVGTDMVDIDCATNHGVAVTNTPGSNAVSVAEQGILLMLALSRNLIPLHEVVSKLEPYRQDGTYARLQGNEISGKQLGLVGFGAVGKELAKRAVAMGVETLAFDPFVSDDFIESLDVTPADFNTVLSASDFVALCCPLTDQTRGLINVDSISLMKPTSYIINIARAGLINSQALADALVNKTIAGAALDVTNPEPPAPDDPILKAPNVIFSGHQGGNTKECWDNMCLMSVENVMNYFEDKEPVFRVN